MGITLGEPLAGTLVEAENQPGSAATSVPVGIIAFFMRRKTQKSLADHM